MRLSDSMLVESQTFRDQGLTEVDRKSSDEAILSAVKEVFFAMWQGGSYMTTQQVAEFYEVPENTIRQNYKRYRPEFDSDQAARVSGKQLRELRDIVSLSSHTPSVVMFSARATLRMGFILNGSPVAREVRTAALNLIQGVGQLAQPDILGSLITAHPSLSSVVPDGELCLSAPLELFYSKVRSRLKKEYPDGGIPGFRKNEIREQIASLSTCTENLKLETQKELSLELDFCERQKYPDLTSSEFLIPINGQRAKAVFMLQIDDMMTDFSRVELSIGKNYIDLAKRTLGVDYAFLFFVSPFGLTPDAKEYIEKHLPSDIRGFVGAMTVKEIAYILMEQARRERKTGLISGQIAKQFSEILNYPILEDEYFPGDVVQASLLDI